VSWFRRGPVEAAAGWPYMPDARDRVVPLADVPSCDEGAAMPVVLASDFRLLLIYLMQETPAGWDGTEVTVVSADSEEMPVAVIEFQRPYSHIFGPPNDEAIIGHPLASRGLHPCGAFTVEHSSWLRALQRMDAVHERHAPGRFRSLTHYIFTFRDSTLECAASDFTTTLHRGSLRDVAAKMAARLW
jgi:hypothetical protein